MTLDIIKYPRTPHLTGSRLQPGDVDDGIGLADLPDGLHIWEEKLDGANTGVFFDENANMVLQSRGHRMLGGARERQFDMLKAWASAHQDELFDVLGHRYVMYNEDLFVKHSSYYDCLPAYAFEEDILDKQTMTFLSTERRQALLAGTSFVSVPILHEGRITKALKLPEMVKRSLYCTEAWQDNLAVAAKAAGVDPAVALSQTDRSGLAEGLYLKIEDPKTGTVIGRYKWVRASFVQTILDSGSHWNERPIIQNGLAPGVDIFAAPGSGIAHDKV